MEIQEFIEKFAEIFDETEASEITPTTKFKELEEWSSLMALSTIAVVDEEFDITLNGEDIRRAETVEELYDIVNSKK